MAHTTELKIQNGEAENRTSNYREAAKPLAPKKASQSRRKTAYIIIGLILLIGLVVGGVIWSRRGLVTVQTGKVTREDITAIVTASGQIMPPPDDIATVNANSFGKVTEILVQEGDRVTKGELLMRTEDVQQQANVQAQQAALSTSRADLSASEAAVTSATASLKTAQANLAQAEAKFKQAQADYQRGQQALKEQLIARQVFDQNLSDYQVARANLQSAQSQVAQQKAMLQQAVYTRDMRGASVRQSQAQLLYAQNVYQQTIYKSPFDGIITSLPVHTGENVVPGVQNQTGSVLFQVANLSVITAKVDVDESDIVNVKMGQTAQVSIDAIPDKTFSAKVTQIGMTAIDENTGQVTTSSSSTTGTGAKDFQVEVTLDNPPPNMRPGLSATAKITTATKHDVLGIPIQALTIRQKGELEKENKQGATVALAATRQAAAGSSKDESKKEIQGVFVVRNGRAVFVPVKTGIMGTMNVEVLDGLKAGDEIVTGSYQVLRTLKNNTKIKVNNSAVLGPTAPTS